VALINQIIQGNALEVLQKLPSEYVNCIVTSPPYLGLRDYGIEPIIWDGDKDCKHEWGNKIKGNDKYNRWHTFGDYRVDGGAGKREIGVKNISQGQFCIKCNAWKGSLGLEPTFELYLKHLCNIFDECKRVLRKDGTCWVNLGDTYGQNRSNVPDKSLCLIPFRFAIEMTNRGWICRNVIIWKKPNCMPSSAKDRFTIDFDYVFFYVKSNDVQFWTNEKTGNCVDKQPLGTKGIEGIDWEWKEVGNYQGKDTFSVRVRDSNKPKYLQKATEEEKENYGKGKIKKISLWTGHDYWFEQVFEPHLSPVTNKIVGRKGTDVQQSQGDPKGYRAYGEQGRNKRCLWTIPTKPFSGAHFAVYPEALIEPMIQAGCPRYVCKECGKGRKKIYEVKRNKNIVINKGINPHWANGDNRLDKYGGGFSERYKKENPQTICKGYTDCGCNVGFEPGVVLDPFMGAGTTAVVAKKQGKNYIGIEIKQEYIDMANKRLKMIPESLF